MIALVYKFRGFVRPHAVRLSLGLVAIALSVLAGLAQPWPLKVVVDSVLNNHPFPAWIPHFVRSGSNDLRIALLSLALLAIVGLGGLLTYVGTYWSQSVGQRVVYDIREVVHTHLHRLSLAYHHSQSPGDLANRLTTDVDRILTVVISLIVNVATSVLMLVGMVVIMFYVNWLLALLAIALTPVLFATIYRYKGRMKSSTRRARQKEGRVAALVQESLSAIHVVQAYTREDYEFERFRRESEDSLASGIEATAVQARFSPLVEFITAVAIVVVLWVGAHEVLAGSLTLGLLLVFISYVKSFYSPLKQLSNLSYLVARGTASAERLTEILDTAPVLPQAKDPFSPGEVRGAVEFEDVSFRYPLGEDAALRDVSFSASPGEVVALVGPTGAGKSTILSLIPRFYDVARGAVRIDGVDVREWDLKALRDNVGVVLQDTWIFQASIVENILYGRPRATEEEAVAAARAANAHEFVERLPEGYETVVGPRGATLSGGERQRIAIARAMLRAAPILILDEPTTGLDPENAQVVLDALRRLMEGRTTIVIAHGEAPVAMADRVLVVDGGAIVEEGTLQELRRGGRRYRRLQRIPGETAVVAAGSPVAVELKRATRADGQANGGGTRTGSDLATVPAPAAPDGSPGRSNGQSTSPTPRRRWVRVPTDRARAVLERASIAERIGTAATLLCAVCGGLAALYAVMALIGEIDPIQAGTAAIVTLALGAIWFAGVLARLRRGRAPDQRRDRERRGF